MILSSFHNHTKLCNHAEGMPRDYLLGAKDFLGSEHICSGFGFSDHCPYPKDNSDNWPEVRMKPEEASDYVKEVREVSFLVDFPVYAGFECEWDPVYQSWYKDFLLAELNTDYLVLGQHWVVDGSQRLYIPEVVDNKRLLHKWTDSILQALDTGLFAFFAHPDVCMARGEVMNDDLKACYKAMLEFCESKKIPVEVNGYGIIKTPVKDKNGDTRMPYPYKPFWEMVKDYDVPVICNSDSHKPDRALSGAKKATDYALEMGFTPITTIFD